MHLEGQGAGQQQCPARTELCSRRGLGCRSRRSYVTHHALPAPLQVAAGLLLMLGLVLWRRRMLRHQQQARQFVQAGPGGPLWAVPPMAAPEAQPPAAAVPPLAPAAVNGAAGGSGGRAAGETPRVGEADQQPQPGQPPEQPPEQQGGAT